MTISCYHREHQARPGHLPYTVQQAENAFAMPTKRIPNVYQSYLLRLWRDSADEPWRISLQSTRDGSQHFFANLEDAWAFLRRRMRLEKPP